MFNEFEIRAIKEDKKEVKILEVNNISEEYNMQEYEVILFKAIVSFEYKGAIFNTNCGQIFTKDISNVQYLKNKVKHEIESIEYFLYQDWGENGAYLSQFASFITHQIELLSVKKEQPIEDGLPKIREKVISVISQEKNNKKSNLSIYEFCIKRLTNK